MDSLISDNTDWERLKVIRQRFVDNTLVRGDVAWLIERATASIVAVKSDSVQESSGSKGIAGAPLRGQDE